jgi:hypothetical protein
LEELRLLEGALQPEEGRELLLTAKEPHPWRRACVARALEGPRHDEIGLSGEGGPAHEVGYRLVAARKLAFRVEPRPLRSEEWGEEAGVGEEVSYLLTNRATPVKSSVCAVLQMAISFEKTFG